MIAWLAGVWFSPPTGGTTVKSWVVPGSRVTQACPATAPADELPVALDALADVTPVAPPAPAFAGLTIWTRHGAAAFWTSPVPGCVTMIVEPGATPCGSTIAQVSPPVVADAAVPNTPSSHVCGTPAVSPGCPSSTTTVLCPAPPLLEAPDSAGSPGTVEQARVSGRLAAPAPVAVNPAMVSARSVPRHTTAIRPHLVAIFALILMHPPRSIRSNPVALNTPAPGPRRRFVR